MKGADNLLEFILPYKYSDDADGSVNNVNDNDSVSVFPRKTPLAMAYVPFQQWEEPYSPNKALSAGTVFPSLDLPFTGKEV